MLKQSPSRHGSIRRGAAAVLATALGVLVLAGCAAGQDAQTVGQRPPIDGASASAGDISVRAAALLAPTSGSSYAKGSSAQLRLVLINNGDSNDTLTAVSSPAASGAQISDAGSSAGASDTGSAGSSATSSSSSASSPTASASTAGGSGGTTPGSSPASQPITLPPGDSVMIGYGDGPSISLTGLTQDLFPAQSLPITLTFGSGATVTLTVPVALSSQQPSAPVVSDATAGTD